MADQGTWSTGCITLVHLANCDRREQKELPYPLISDPERKLIAALGAAEGGKTKRSHFIFAKGGKLVEKQNPVKPADRYARSLIYTALLALNFIHSPQLALEFVKSLKADSA